MSDDSYTDTLGSESADGLSRALDRINRQEQVLLRYSKLVKPQVFIGKQFPFWQAIRYLRGQCIEFNASPFSHNLAHPAVKISTHAVEIHSEDKVFHAPPPS